jgi:hypothetical protein
MVVCDHYRMPSIDTVERFQGGERTVMMVSATESDRGYLLASAGFLLDTRRSTVAVSRAKRKMILAASRSVFSLLSPDKETVSNALLWKNLLATFPDRVWEEIRDGVPVADRGALTRGGTYVEGTEHHARIHNARPMPVLDSLRPARPSQRQHRRTGFQAGYIALANKLLPGFTRSVPKSWFVQKLAEWTRPERVQFT